MAEFNRISKENKMYKNTLQPSLEYFEQHQALFCPNSLHLYTYFEHKRKRTQKGNQTGRRSLESRATQIGTKDVERSALCIGIMLGRIKHRFIKINKSI